MRRLVLLVACLVALAGCTSSTDETAKTRKTLESVLLQLSDFPPTWRSFAPSAQAGDLLGEVAACTGLKQDEHSILTVHSGEFRNGEQHITSTAVAYPDHEGVSRIATTLGAANAPRCMDRAMGERASDVLPGATVTSSRFTVQEGGVNVAINYAGSATGVVDADVEGHRSQVYIDAVFLLGDNFYADLTFLGINERVSDYIRQVLTADVALRAQHT